MTGGSKSLGLQMMMAAAAGASGNGTPVAPPTFSRLVILGASIMQRTFSARLSTMQAALSSAGAPGIDVISMAVSGDRIADTMPILASAMTTYPSNTLFFIHTGGNNVSANRPYPGGEAQFLLDYSALIDQAATRPGCVICSDLTYRDYANGLTSGDNTISASDEAVGSKPYNDNVLLGLFQSRRADLADRAYYGDGTPVSCLYEWSYSQGTDYLGDAPSDVIHPSDSGEVLLLNWLAERLAPVLSGSALPLQATRATLGIKPPDPITVTPVSDIFVDFSYEEPSRDPNVNYPFSSTSDFISTPRGPFSLDRFDQSTTNVTLAIEYTATPNTNANQAGINDAGRSNGVNFDPNNPELKTNLFTSQSLYSVSGTTVTYMISGSDIIAGASYEVQLVASRAASDVRVTRFVFHDGQTADLNVTANPVADPAVVTVAANANGEITFTQSTVQGGWSYLGGFRLRSAS